MPTCNMQCLHAICNAYMHHAMPTCTMQCLHALCNAYMHFNQHCSDIHPFIDFHNHSEFATHFRNTMHSKYTITPPFLLPFIQSSHHHPPFILLITNNYEILQPPPPLPFRLQLPSPFPSSSSPSLQLPSPLPFILLPFPSASSPSLQLPPPPSFRHLLPISSQSPSCLLLYHFTDHRNANFIHVDVRVRRDNRTSSKIHSLAHHVHTEQTFFLLKDLEGILKKVLEYELLTAGHKGKTPHTISEAMQAK